MPIHTVSRELGHSATRMVEKVCSHFGTVRHCAEVVEFRVAQYKTALLADGAAAADWVEVLSAKL